MRIKDLSEGFASGFKQGYNKPIVAPATKTGSSAFNSLNPRDAKAILAAILNGQQLDKSQISKLQKIYNNL